MRTAHSDTDRRAAGREVQEVLFGHVVAVQRGPGCGREEEEEGAEEEALHAG
jgi:hypothetical protein